MSSEQFKQLSKFINDIEKLNSNEFFIQYLSNITGSIEESSSNNLELKKDFLSDVNKLITKYELKGLDNDEMTIGFYHILLDRLKKKVIYQYALKLGISPTLYKKEMGFLFKGKT